MLLSFHSLFILASWQVSGRKHRPSNYICKAKSWIKYIFHLRLDWRTPLFAANSSIDAGANQLLAALRLDPAHPVVVDDSRSRATGALLLHQLVQDVHLVGHGPDPSHGRAGTWSQTEDSVGVPRQTVQMNEHFKKSTIPLKARRSWVWILGCVFLWGVCSGWMFSGNPLSVYFVIWLINIESTSHYKSVFSRKVRHKGEILALPSLCIIESAETLTSRISVMH